MMNSRPTRKPEGRGPFRKLRRIIARVVAGIPEPLLQALRHGAVHGAGRAQKIQTTPPAAPGCKPVQRLLRNALRQDGVVDDGHMSLQRARRDAGPAIRQKAETEHGGPAGKCCNFFTICRQIHRKPRLPNRN